MSGDQRIYDMSVMAYGGPSTPDPITREIVPTIPYEPIVPPTLAESMRHGSGPTRREFQDAIESIRSAIRDLESKIDASRPKGAPPVLSIYVAPMDEEGFVRARCGGRVVLRRAPDARERAIRAALAAHLERNLGIVAGEVATSSVGVTIRVLDVSWKEWEAMP